MPFRFQFLLAFFIQYSSALFFQLLVEKRLNIVYKVLSELLVFNIKNKTKNNSATLAYFAFIVYGGIR